MKFLFLCNKLPYPANEGGSMAMNMMIEGMLEAGHQVKVLAISSYKNPYDSSKIPESYKTKTKLEAIHLNLKPRLIPALYCFFLRKSYHVHRFISKKFDDKLTQVLKDEEFDIIQIETVFLTPYLKTIKKYSKAKVFLRAHNIEHLIWQRLAENTNNPIKKLYLDHLSVQLKNYEIDHLDSYDGIICISEIDRKYYSNFTTKEIITATFGIKPNDYQLAKNEENMISLFFIGAMNWMPNAEGLKWFLDKVWPEIHENFSDLKFNIASKDIPHWLKKYESNQLKLVGEVTNAKDFISANSIMIVPLLSGSGIRIKIIEGMASGKAVIATSIGAEGIEYQNGKDILLADTKAEFIDQIKKCLIDSEYRKSIGINARNTILENHNSKIIIQDLLSDYQNTLK
jgi:glycosyltransferase involved in cell wall biosynthesis